MNAYLAEMLRSIQALSIAAHEQTGVPTCLSVYTTSPDNAPLTIHASVTIMPHVGKVWSIAGTTSPHRGPDSSLEGLRDELATWIAENRKETTA